MNGLTTFIEFIGSYPLWARLLAFSGLAVTILTFILAPRAKLTELSAGITIRSPKYGSSVPWSFTVTGTCKNVPKEDDLWIFTTEDKQKKYWPQARIILKNDSTWEGRVNGLGGQIGESRTFGVFQIGKEGKVLLGLYKRSDLSRNGISLEELTSDIRPLKEVSVVLNSRKP